MLTLAGIFCLLYIWALAYQGQINSEITKYFSLEQIAQGRSYARFLRLLFISGFCVNIALLLWLAFGAKASELAPILYSLMLWTILNIVNLPFTYLSSFYWSHRWGFSTQTIGNWWGDYLKTSAIELLLFIIGFTVLFWIMNKWPRTWWIVGAVTFSLWLVVQMYLWPIIVSPLFNSFSPVKDPLIITMVQELSQKADIPVEEVLVMDASRRTTKANAYFAGLGSTKRIVLYDTLINNYPLDEVEAVVAHEMAHWKEGHIFKGLIYGVLGNFLLWIFLFYLYRITVPSGLKGSPQTIVLFLLFLSLVSFIGAPLENYISRGMEREADRVAVTLTGDSSAAVRLHLNLAKKNLSDVEPHPFIKWYSYTHPDSLTRIKQLEGYGLNQ
ncbi:MAG: endopeptidase [Firmicutes bacterium HGW-Firmicutes-12]|nr:MAG: endopeptidase [Firmicutes bacterium HGW-Firmicutes-12]